MKRMIRISAAYLVFGLSVGILYHEAASYMQFTGKSMLRVVHGHALLLGALVFLAVPVLMKVFQLEEQKQFHKFVRLYNVGLVLSLLFMSVRGITQLFQMELPGVADHMIGGMAGVGHFIMTGGIVAFYKAYLGAVQEK